MRDSEEDGKPGEDVSKNGAEFHGPMPPPMLLILRPSLNGVLYGPSET